MSFVYETLVGVSNDLSNWENFYSGGLSSLCISGEQWHVNVVSSCIDYHTGIYLDCDRVRITKLCNIWNEIFSFLLLVSLLILNLTFDQYHYNHLVTILWGVIL
ncbi:hypothetical protein AAZV13_18G050600 [Glycine max]